MNLFISIFKIILRIGLGFACVVILAEITLQVLPVKTGFKRPTHIEENVPPHWQPNQSFTYSSGWRMDNPQTGWINNVGYPSPHDFIEGKQAIIVIGDSFIENQMNPWESTFMGQLHSEKLPVYSFGLSGANIADYLGIANYSVKKYKPKHMIIMLADGDISSSSYPYQTGHYFIQSKELKQKTYNHKNAKIRNFFKQSALIRYIMMNLQLQRKFKSLFRKNASTQASPKTNLQERYAFFIKTICDISKKNKFKITLLNYNNELEKSIFDHETKQCSNINWIHTFDLIADLKQQNPNIRLDYLPYDGHWNTTMHQHVYEELKKKLPF